MLDESQVRYTLQKLKRFEDTLEAMIFEKAVSLEDVRLFETKDDLYQIPDVPYREINKGDVWGGEGVYGFFKTRFHVPDELIDRPIYLMPHTQGYESLLWVNGQPFGTYATKIVVTTHGNHYCDMISMHPKKDEDIDICVECYCGHYVRGTQPFEYNGRKDFSAVYGGMYICVKNKLIDDFYFDLKTINEIVESLDTTSYRRSDLMNTLEMAHRVLYLDPDNVSRNQFEDGLREASKLLKIQLSKHNGPTAPFAAFTGHSHMDTAWLWHIGETIKKCARTYSNQLSLMEQYPEHRFMQSSAFHGELLLTYYPELFARIRAKVLEKRYEPNGAVYVECDCNITGGESMIRQFLWGQRFTREHFNYTSDTFWLPDTFGYSAAIPQIMKKCGVKYFVTTKLSWNDTTDFPFDSFIWAGLDGTRVLAHFPKTHDFPCPKTLAHFLYTKNRRGDVVKDKRLSQMKLVGYGFGDGGGGPQFEQLEMARRLGDVEGVPRTQFMSVSDFMRTLEHSMPEPPVYHGELYLEYHRGTLTNQHEIKRNNRLCEIALHDLEWLTVSNAVSNHEIAWPNAIRPLTRAMLINQFHDILPGTGIPRVNEECRRDITNAINEAHMLSDVLLTQEQGSSNISLTNTLSFQRDDTVYLNLSDGILLSAPVVQQRVKTIDGENRLAVAKIMLNAFETREFSLTVGKFAEKSAFEYHEDTLLTPFARIHFTPDGFMDSFYDLREMRELVGEGYPLNTFLIAEDVSAKWDSWDIDADILPKFKPESALISREVVSDGPIELRIQSEYRLTDKSKLTQQIIFSAFSPIVRFDTVIHWQDDHRFLKTAFDTSIFAPISREEVQFGYVTRSTYNNTPQDIAKFEVSCHKYADISEGRFGISILNDCKYGISAKGGCLRLSLHKGGCNPDFNGDKGNHKVSYAFLPHAGGFSADSVIKPAYIFNYPILQGHTTGAKLPVLFDITGDSIICEAIKPCEDAQKAYIIRLYEAEGSYSQAKLKVRHQSTVTETNMLEENLRVLNNENEITLAFAPFEIKTLKIRYE